MPNHPLLVEAGISQQARAPHSLEVLLERGLSLLNRAESRGPLTLLC